MISDRECTIAINPFGVISPEFLQNCCPHFFREFLLDVPVFILLMNLNLQYNGHEIRGFNTLSISGLRGGMYFLYHSIPWMVTLSPFQRDESCPIHSRNALSHSLFKEEGVMQQMNHEYEIVEKQGG